MNLIIIDSKDVNDDLTVYLSPRQSSHCIAVLEVNIGSKLSVGVKNSGKGTATVINILRNLEVCDTSEQSANKINKKDNFIIEKRNELTRDSNIFSNEKKGRKAVSEINVINEIKSTVIIKLDSPFHKNPYSGEYPLIDLIVALPRPKVFEKVLQFATTAGVGRIFFVCTSKSEKSYLNSSKMRKESIDEIVQLGLEQSCTTLCPEIYVYASWNFFLRHIDTFFSDKTIKIVGDVSGNKRVSEVGLQEHSGPALLAVGPEGGWTPGELDIFKEKGFNIVNIGERVLKVETALISLFSKVDLLLTDTMLRNGKEKPKRDKYWTRPNEGPGAVVLPVKGRKWENKYLFTHHLEFNR